MMNWKLTWNKHKCYTKQKIKERKIRLFRNWHNANAKVNDEWIAIQMIRWLTQYKNTNVEQIKRRRNA